MAWEPTIGLEVHVQLATRTKLFCRCAWRFGAQPNTLVCPVCLGHPGVLPVLNARAVEQGARAALSLGMTVNRESKFDRKNYFYPDLPKGYQISQFDEPLAQHGSIRLDDGTHVRIRRLHLEEDAGKAIHDRGDFGLVDFNRAGAPLAEIVSEPDLATPPQATEYLDRLKQTLRWAGVSDCDMEKGNLRVDINVSVAPAGRRATGTRCEVKNVNSFQSVARALEHEIGRQIAVLESGGTVRQETRTWDEAAGQTRVMRVKEEADDYRYFPDPDLPRLQLSAEWIEAQRAALPEPQAQRRRRYEQALGLSEYDARVLTAERETSAYFERLLAAGSAPKEAANWLVNDVLSWVPPGGGVDDQPIPPEYLAAVLQLRHDGRINRNGGRALLEARAGGDLRSPQELVSALGLETQSDAGALEQACRRAIAAQPKAADDVRAGKEKALGALLGFVMRETRGAADAGKTRAILLRLLQP
ncbi:MAG: Asp-tRNA(Asn)/Glu-tRNA(Gln) amidotransferase subunit GatB [Planctomycetota bacterium]|nr:MAG: Asp-tRNA(Asn)/Glu-tRNA(Gln) amidotransferase subunit GatB [Planctomycetota bacterium]